MPLTLFFLAHKINSMNAPEFAIEFLKLVVPLLPRPKIEMPPRGEPPTLPAIRRVTFQDISPITPLPTPGVIESFPVATASLPEGLEYEDTAREVPIAVEEQPITETSPTQRVACVGCSRAHLATISGTLSEALRFAREGGIGHPEVQRRILAAEEEISVMERFDLAPDAIAASPQVDQVIVHRYLPDIRSLRQAIGDIKSVEDLEVTAAQAQNLGQAFRMAALKGKGVDIDKIAALARKVQAGEMDMDEAKAKVREMLAGKE